MFDLKKRVGYILAFLFLFLLPFTVFAEGRETPFRELLSANFQTANPSYRL